MDAMDTKIEKYIDLNFPKKDIIQYINLQSGTHRDTIKKHYKKIMERRAEEMRVRDKLKRMESVLNGTSTQ